MDYGRITTQRGAVMARLSRTAKEAAPFAAVSLGALAFHEIALAITVGFGVVALIGAAAGMDLVEAWRVKR